MSEQSLLVPFVGAFTGSLCSYGIWKLQELEKNKRRHRECLDSLIFFAESLRSNLNAGTTDGAYNISYILAYSDIIKSDRRYNECFDRLYWIYEKMKQGGFAELVPSREIDVVGEVAGNLQQLKGVR